MSTTEQPSAQAPRPTPMATVTDHATGRQEHVWSLPVDEAFLDGFLRHLFETHHDKLTFGPMIQGAAYEMKAPGKPKRITLGDGYWTVFWHGGGHFHLCLGTNYGTPDHPTPPALIAKRRPGRAELFRGLDRAGHPVTWGFRMFNGDKDPQITIFFPNPFITDEDEIAAAPDWSRLALWHEILERYTGHAPDGLDTTGKGFGHG
ncbi:hypothetical protein EV659_105193 [Rhodothalassium salexigens DSM 2132]|uniref:Uncharacterized protein n=1 Tax=Rhodothalassium salexigens DSM 2132 TaxID=1188247 RepID=A0A4R2PGQ2_RHOSA|nr:hypothetical protein [Rhodothalassium salexigens]MBB4211505.1 hypothetical protein [Rhodothalassium salexigens DSM 2132]MBK1639742.1 hypothetical protein [Rhodothalassium salexigens DSM 2132]TCP34563.1 hypothetical protein EV659_105193 [Rhodothalassium salexigens DSM 2132]